MLKTCIIDALNEHSENNEELVKELMNIAIKYSLHDTHFETLKKCVMKCVEDEYLCENSVPMDIRIDLAKLLFQEINDFKISADIAAQKMKTTQYIAKTKRDNIERIKK